MGHSPLSHNENDAGIHFASRFYMYGVEEVIMVLHVNYDMLEEMCGEATHGIR
jgi:hypothetical protein